jgi:hypothetical protein
MRNSNSAAIQIGGSSSSSRMTLFQLSFKLLILYCTILSSTLCHQIFEDSLRLHSITMSWCLLLPQANHPILPCPRPSHITPFPHLHTKTSLDSLLPARRIQRVYRIKILLLLHSRHLQCIPNLKHLPCLQDLKVKTWWNYQRCRHHFQNWKISMKFNSVDYFATTQH